MYAEIMTLQAKHLLLQHCTPSSVLKHGQCCSGSSLHYESGPEQLAQTAWRRLAEQARQLHSHAFRRLPLKLIGTGLQAAKGCQTGNTVHVQKVLNLHHNSSQPHAHRASAYRVGARLLTPFFQAVHPNVSAPRVRQLLGPSEWHPNVVRTVSPAALCGPPPRECAGARSRAGRCRAAAPWAPPPPHPRHPPHKRPCASSSRTCIRDD